MKLKTLKDMEGLICNLESHRLHNAIKAEAIKWVKEERVIKENLKEGLLDIFTQEQRWMKRLNITEDDLK